MSTVTVGTGLSTAVEVLDAGWGWISGNPILFGICCLGLAVAGVRIVKSFF